MPRWTRPQSRGPLEGLRVVCAAVNAPGPVAAARLADLEARVTKVEPPDLLVLLPEDLFVA